MIKVGDVLKSKCGESVIKIAFILENTSIGNVYCVAYPDLDNEIGWINQKEIEADYDITKEKWRPVEGEGYYYIDGFYGNVCFYSHSDMNEGIVSFGNYFETKAEAILARDKIREVLKGE
jgi:hypothetical protein